MEDKSGGSPPPPATGGACDPPDVSEGALPLFFTIEARFIASTSSGVIIFTVLNEKGRKRIVQ